MYLVGVEVTIQWRILATELSISVGDLDLMIVSPDSAVTYLDSPLLSADFTAPASSSAGDAFYRFTPDSEGMWQIRLVVGSSDNYQILSKVDMFVFGQVSATPYSTVYTPVEGGGIDPPTATIATWISQPISTYSPYYVPSLSGMTTSEETLYKTKREAYGPSTFGGSDLTETLYTATNTGDIIQLNGAAIIDVPGLVDYDVDFDKDGHYVIAYEDDEGIRAYTRYDGSYVDVLIAAGGTNPYITLTTRVAELIDNAETIITYEEDDSRATSFLDLPIMLEFVFDSEKCKNIVNGTATTTGDISGNWENWAGNTLLPDFELDADVMQSSGRQPPSPTVVLAAQNGYPALRFEQVTTLPKILTSTDPRMRMAGKKSVFTCLVFKSMVVPPTSKTTIRDHRAGSTSPRFAVALGYFGSAIVRVSARRLDGDSLSTTPTSSGLGLNYDATIWNIVCVSLSAETGILDVWINGEKTYVEEDFITSTGTQRFDTAEGARSLTLGADGDSNTTSAEMDLLHFSWDTSNIPDDDTIQKISSSLAYRYGIPEVLDDSNPYKLAVPTRRFLAGGIVTRRNSLVFNTREDILGYASTGVGEMTNVGMNIDESRFCVVASGIGEAWQDTLQFTARLVGPTYLNSGHNDGPQKSVSQIVVSPISGDTFVAFRDGWVAKSADNELWIPHDNAFGISSSEFYTVNAVWGIISTSTGYGNTTPIDGGFASGVLTYPISHTRAGRSIADAESEQGVAYHLGSNIYMDVIYVGGTTFLSATNYGGFLRSDNGGYTFESDTAAETAAGTVNNTGASNVHAAKNSTSLIMISNTFVARTFDSGDSYDSPTLPGTTYLTAASNESFFMVGSGDLYRSDDDCETFTSVLLSGCANLIGTSGDTILAVLSGAISASVSFDNGATFAELPTMFNITPLVNSGEHMVVITEIGDNEFLIGTSLGNVLSLSFT